MTIIQDGSMVHENKTMQEYNTYPHSENMKQVNFRMPENLLLSLRALTENCAYNQAELISLALFNLLSEKDYLNKKPANKKTVKI